MAWIKTYTGAKFDPLGENIGKFNIVDIAHALAMQCRFGGHTRRFYSVAEHCVNASKLPPLIVVEEKWAENKWECLSSLLHDASEAYLVDIPRPIKHSLELKGYRKLEKIVQQQIDAQFGTNHELAKPYDEAMLSIEIHQLMPNPEDYDVQPNPGKFALECLSPAQAERRFLDRFYQLSIA